MKEFEPKLKKEIFNREFFSKYIYVLVIGLCLLLGVSYSLTFFIQNKSIANGTISTGNLTVTFTDRTINASDLTAPATNYDGLREYNKSLTITNTSSVKGKVKLTISRTSGLNLEDMAYALIVNSGVQEIGNMPSNGEILTTAIMPGETIDVEIRLWPKTTYEGVEDTFAGEIVSEISYLTTSASDVLSNSSGKYVNFNCSENTCEKWQIVEVDDDRLVLTRQADYTGATEREDSGKYVDLSLNDDSLITSVSSDNDHKNVYLAKTVKIVSGSGTVDNPYELASGEFSEKDKKKVAIITYKDNDTTIGTQSIYYNENNFIGKELNTTAFIGWTDGESTFQLGDSVSFSEDTILSVIKVFASDLQFNNSVTNFDCTTAQCALEELNDYIS